MPDGFDALLAAARRGEGQAYAELWRRHAGVVAAFACGREAADVDELVSDVFVSVCAAVGSFTGDEAGFRALAFTVARRRLVDERRRRGRRPPTAPLEVRDDELSPSAEDDVLRREAAREARALLADLTDDQRDVLTLRFLGDLSIEQVAEVLGKRVGAVKALQHRALATLRRAAEQAGFAPETTTADAGGQL